MIALSLCRKIPEDAAVAFSWRNDPATIASSYLPLPKTWDSFWLEYEELYFDVPGLFPRFILKDGEKVGFIRFEKTSVSRSGEETDAEIIINIRPENRRQGIACLAVEKVKEEMRAAGVRALVADIRRENTPSVRLFEKCGFSFYAERSEFVSKIQKKCHILRYCCVL